MRFGWKKQKELGMNLVKRSLEKITNKNIYHILQIIFVSSIIPILMLAFYNYPCADDFSI